MESFNLHKGYGKVSSFKDQLQSPPKKLDRKHHISAIAILAILLLTVIIGFMLVALVHKSKSPGEDTEEEEEVIKSVCKVTRYPESCFTAISSAKTSKLDPELALNISLNASINQLKNLSSTVKDLSSTFKDLHGKNAAVADCVSLVDNALHQLADCVKEMNDVAVLTRNKINNIQTWISAAMTDQGTCGDGLKEMESSSSSSSSTIVIDDQVVKEMMKKSKEYLSNSLAIVANMQTLVHKFGRTLH